MELLTDTATEETESSDEEIEKTIRKVSLETSGVKNINQYHLQVAVCHVPKFTNIAEIHITYESKTKKFYLHCIHFTLLDVTCKYGRCLGIL
jgi:hypothetical protein